MAVRRQQYAKKLERELAGGKSLKKAHAAAAKTGKVDAAKREKKNWVIRLKEAVSLSFRAKQEDTANKKRYLEYYKKIGPKKHTLTYVQWLKNQKDK